MRRLLDALPPRGEQAASAVALEALTSIRRSRVDGMLKQLAVDGAAERAGSGWLATGEPWVFAREHYEGVVATRRREADIMRRYVRGERCLMQLLQEALDDPSAAPCGRCSACLGRLPDGVPARPSDAVTRSVATLLLPRATTSSTALQWPAARAARASGSPAGPAGGGRAAPWPSRTPPSGGS